MSEEEKGPDGGTREPALTRRQVLGAGLAAGAGAVAATVPVVRFLSPSAATGAALRAEIPADRVGLWSAQRVLVGGRPGFVVRTPGEIYAVSGVCTHLGCIVRWQRSRKLFFCPCHGGRFAADGRVLGGPPPAPLERFQVAVNQGKIVVESA